MINWKELSNEIRQTLPGIRLLEEEPLGEAAQDSVKKLRQKPPERGRGNEHRRNRP